MPVESRDISDPTWGDGVALLEGAGIRVAERPRHPTRVTADRIAEHLDKYADQLTPNEVAACEKVCRAFADIAEGRRA